MSFIEYLHEWDACSREVEQMEVQVDEAAAINLTKDMVRAVYRRDYYKTKDRPYRKYVQAKRSRQKK